MEFTEEIAKLAVERLRKKGIKFSEGLSEAEVKAVEDALGAKIPPDLKTLLKVAVPTGKKDGGSFPNWHINPSQIVADSRYFIEEAFMLDITEAQYWHESFGPKPADLNKAKEQALKVIRTWPPLMKVYSHRHMPTEPSLPGTPVLSVWQAVDSIYYGYNLAHYLQREFEIELPVPIPAEPPRVPYWGDAFDLLCERD